MLCRLLAVFGGLMIALWSSSSSGSDFDEEYETRTWQEVEVALPSPPAQASLLPFYVSAATVNQFLIDSNSLNVGKDGVVRYTLVVLSSNGVRNVSYEGIRCETRERRIYAAGRADGSWSKAQRNEWVRIQEAYANRHHAALFLSYFCPFGNVVHDAEEARLALRNGGHPDVRR